MNLDQRKKYLSVLIQAAFSAMLSVIFLALASHALPKILDEIKVSAITTAAQIQLFHAILIISSYQLIGISKKVKFEFAFKLIFYGSLIFSISIYLLSFRELLGMPWLKVLGPITPLGGILLIVGWALLALRLLVLKMKG
ncbi:MAG: DUF423 domain-containing protein [Bacteroidia bacterium]